jgi:hypothetical protein
MSALSPSVGEPVPRFRAPVPHQRDQDARDQDAALMGRLAEFKAENEHLGRWALGAQVGNEGAGPWE